LRVALHLLEYDFDLIIAAKIIIEPATGHILSIFVFVEITGGALLKRPVEINM
jgi:hypothetical protein